MATEIADAKQDQAVTDAAPVEESSATTEVSETQSQETQNQTSPVQEGAPVAGEPESRAESTAEAKPEVAEEAQPTPKSRTARRIQELLEAKKKAEQALALKDEEVNRLRTLPNSAQPAAQSQPSQLPQEQTSQYWAQQYHRAQQEGTATPQELQHYANQYHSLARQEQMRELDTRVEAKLTETVRKAQYASLVQGQFEEANRLTPFYKNGPNGPEYIKDSPVLTRALAKAQQVGAPVQTQEQLLHWITRAQVDLLSEAATMQSGSNAKLEQKTAEIMGRTALQGSSSGRSVGGSKSLEGLSRDDLEQAAIRQMRGR